jgi:uncharacterized phiE125 gp8 family phage protein
MPIEVTPLDPAPIDTKHRVARWSVVTSPATRPATAAEARTHLRIDDLSQDAYLETLIDAATDFAEEKLAASLMPRTLMANFYDGEALILPRGPIIEVLSIVDADDQYADDYELKTVGNQTLVMLISGSLTYPISVTYRAGYVNAAGVATLPASIKLAILQHVATLYENRETVSDKSKMPVPHTLEAFYRLKSRAPGVG